MKNLLRTRGQESSTQIRLVILPTSLVIPSGLTARNLLLGSSTARNDIALRLEPKDADESAHAEAEDRKLRKDP
jgi:hypothetical protein